MPEWKSGGTREMWWLGGGEEGVQGCPQRHLQNANEKLTQQKTQLPQGPEVFQVQMFHHVTLTKELCKPLSWIVLRCSPVLCKAFIYPVLQSLQHTHPAHCQLAKALGPTLRQKRLSICYAFIEWAAEDRRTGNIFVGTEEEAWRESELGTIKIARNSGAPTSRHIQGHWGKYIKYVNTYREPRTNFKEDWKIFF